MPNKKNTEYPNKVWPVEPFNEAELPEADYGESDSHDLAGDTDDESRPLSGLDQEHVPKFAFDFIHGHYIDYAYYTSKLSS